MDGFLILLCETTQAVETSKATLSRCKDWASKETKKSGKLYRLDFL